MMVNTASGGETIGHANCAGIFVHFFKLVFSSKESLSAFVL
jgi:hypothetical protein